MTTSINEGFGFSFLEPWTAGKYLHGRMIKAVCRDFEANGVNLDHLYHQIKIPVEWIDRNRFRKQWESALLAAYTAYGRNIHKSLIKDHFNQIIKHGCIDFGMLSEPHQKMIINRCQSSKDNRSKLTALNPILDRLGLPLDAHDLVLNNKSAVAASYNQAIYRKTLLSTYHKVKGATVRHDIDKEKLLDDFLKPANFSLLKWSVYAP